MLQRQLAAAMTRAFEEVVDRDDDEGGDGGDDGEAVVVEEDGGSHRRDGMGMGKDIQVQVGIHVRLACNGQDDEAVVAVPQCLFPQGPTEGRVRCHLQRMRTEAPSTVTATSWARA